MKKSPNIEKMAVSKRAARSYRYLPGDCQAGRSDQKRRAHKKARKSFKQQLICFLKGAVDEVAYITNCQVGARDVI